MHQTALDWHPNGSRSVFFSGTRKPMTAACIRDRWFRIILTRLALLAIVLGLAVPASGAVRQPKPSLPANRRRIFQTRPRRCSHRPPGCRPPHPRTPAAATQKNLGSPSQTRPNRGEKPAPPPMPPVETVPADTPAPSTTQGKDHETRSIPRKIFTRFRSQRTSCRFRSW